MRHVDSPVDISSENDCRLYIYDSQDATVAIKKHNYHSPTVLVSLEGEKLQEWQQDGGLIGCWSNKRRVYKVRNKARTVWEVCIVDQNNRVNYLRPPSTHIWGSRNISACEEEATGNKAICHAPREPSGNTLDIFNSEGKSHNIKK